MTKRIFAVLALGIATFGLASCEKSADESEVLQAPEGVPGLAVTGARVVLPAVGGNPAAVYFNIDYTGDTNQTLSGLFVEGAESAMMHEYAEKDFKVQMVPMEKLELTKGSKISFEPGGKHGMAMGVSPELAAGGKTEVTLIMASGDKTSVTADIQAAGEAR
ncbi:MAG: copper chaperone PCu(A)C [Pontixanthobacter sp.]